MNPIDARRLALCRPRPRLVAHGCSIVAVAVFSAVAWLGFASGASAQVVIFDGFEDADRDNDGITDGGSVVDANDVGIRWLRVNPQFFDSVDNPTFSIGDDSGGIGTGNALVINQSLQGGADWAGFFGQTITLGSNVGDKLVVSFDTRNLDLTAPDSVAGLRFTTLRFGLWQDSDGQLGTPSTDSDGSATVWGQTDGYFENCAHGGGIGTCGDYGIWGRVQSGAEPTATFPLQADHFSIGEELNANISTGGNDDNELVAVPAAGVLIADYNGDGNVGAADYTVWRDTLGSTTDLAADGDGSQVVDAGDYDTWRANFGASGDPDNALFSDIPIVLTSPRTLSLTLERVTPDATGQDVRIEVAVDGIAFGAQPPDPANPGEGITTRDSFDYFMLVHNAPIDFYLIDNFQVELIDAPGSGSTAVPEPASLQLAMLLLLSAFLACRRWHGENFWAFCFVSGNERRSISLKNAIKGVIMRER